MKICQSFKSKASLADLLGRDYFNKDKLDKLLQLKSKIRHSKVC